jgi:hypothetical protein
VLGERQVKHLEFVVEGLDRIGLGHSGELSWVVVTSR